MASAVQDPRSFPALDEFKQILRCFTLQPENYLKSDKPSPAFVRVRHLRNWLASKTIENGIRVKNIERVLGDAFQKYHGRSSNEPYFYDANAILCNCPLILCMLLEADKGHLIERVSRQSINDENLCKFHEKDLHEKLMKALRPEFVQDHQELFQLFSKRQWAYSPHTFKFGADVELPGSILLPIYKKQQINKRGGACASIHQLCIPEDYLDDSMKQHLAGSSFKQDLVGTCYYLAVKTFTETHDPNDQARRLFERERDAYRQLGDQPGMVQYLGAYSHRNSEDLAEHSILLEYGDYDLAESFLFNPPVLAENVLEFWHNLFNVANALSKLHKLCRQRRGQNETYMGWHADIKPDNMLSVKGILKLADPGFAGFARHAEGENAPRTSVVAMTSTYGAPECNLVSRETVMPQAADMWSLGCVLSEAATWLILGPPGLAQYTTLRQNAIRSANTRNQRRASIHLPPAEDLGEGDYFHDGKSVLPEIRQWHTYLKANLRKSDVITEEVLGIIEGKLLQTKPQLRFRAEDLCAEFDEIKARHAHNHATGLSSAVVEAVTCVEDQLKWRPAAPIGGGGISIQSRKALKSKGHLELPMENVARISDMIKARLELAEPRPLPVANPARRSRKDSGIASPNSPAETWPVIKSFASQVTSPRESSTFSRPEPTESPPKPKPQSIFDAHYAKPSDGKVGGDSRNQLFASMSRVLGGDKRKDMILSRHYDNRDIIFLVDNSASIIPEWQKVRFVLETVARKASYIDKDGMDLIFANGDEEFKIHENNLSKEIERAMAKFKPRYDMETDMGKKLGLLLFKWLGKFDKARAKHKAKAMTLIILTDGCWKGMTKAKAVEDQIVHFDKQFKDLPQTEMLQRYVSIQFISFGEDPGALYRLRHLDNDLVIDRGIDDFIDTEHWTGCVYKMLLGSLDPTTDFRDDESDRNYMESPASYQQGIEPLLPRQSEPRFDVQSSHRRERSAIYPVHSHPSSSMGSTNGYQHRYTVPLPAETASHGSRSPIYPDATSFYRYPS